MPLDEDELKKAEEKNKEISHKAQAALYEALNPREALVAMQEEGYEGGVAFSSHDIASYVEDRIKEVADENPRSGGEASEEPYIEEAKELDHRVSDAVKEQIENLDYIQDEMPDDRGIFEKLITKNEYSKFEFKDYIEESLYEADDVKQVNEGDVTYFTLEEAE